MDENQRVDVVEPKKKQVVSKVKCFIFFEYDVTTFPKNKLINCMKLHSENSDQFLKKVKFHKTSDFPNLSQSRKIFVHFTMLLEKYDFSGFLKHIYLRLKLQFLDGVMEVLDSAENLQKRLGYKIKFIFFMQTKI